MYSPINTPFPHLDRPASAEAGRQALILGKVFGFIYLIASMGALAVFLVPVSEHASVAETPTSFKISWLALFGLTVLILSLLRRPFRKSDTLLFIIPWFLMLSTVWSHSRGATLQYSGMLVFNALATLVIVRCIPRRDFPRFAGRVVLIACVIGSSLFLIGFEPAAYIDVHGRKSLLGLNPMRGLFNHKITSGIGGAIGFFLIFYNERGIFRNISLAFLLLYVLSTGSSLAAAMIVITFAIRGVMLRLNRFRQAGFVYILAMVLLAAFAVVCFKLFGVAVLEALNRDSTLTGRTLLWGWGVNVFFEKPIIGWGYKGYNGTEIAQIAALAFREFQNYDVPHFHNSYIQILVEGGVVLFFMTTAMISYSFNSWSQFSKMHRGARAVPVVFFLIMFGSFLMNQLMQYNNFITMLVFIFFAYAAEAGFKNRSYSLSIPNGPATNR